MKCDWCDSEDVEQVGKEYNGIPILVCKDCGHEFYDLDSKHLIYEDFYDNMLDDYEIQQILKRRK